MEEKKECPFCGELGSHKIGCYLRKMESHIKYLEAYLKFAMKEAKLNTPVADISDVYKDMLEAWNERQGDKVLSDLYNVITEAEERSEITIETLKSLGLNAGQQQVANTCGQAYSDFFSAVYRLIEKKDR